MLFIGATQVPQATRGFPPRTGVPNGPSQSQVRMKRLHIAVVYNAYTENEPEMPDDRSGTSDLVTMIRNVAKNLRRIGHRVTILPLAHDLFRFQRRLRRLEPDVVFNLYDD